MRWRTAGVGSSAVLVSDTGEAGVSVGRANGCVAWWNWDGRPGMPPGYAGGECACWEDAIRAAEAYYVRRHQARGPDSQSGMAREAELGKQLEASRKRAKDAEASMARMHATMHEMAADLQAAQDSLTRMGVPKPGHRAPEGCPVDTALAWRLAWLEGRVAELERRRGDMMSISDKFDAP